MLPHESHFFKMLSRECPSMALSGLVIIQVCEPLNLHDSGFRECYTALGTIMLINISSNRLSAIYGYL